MTLNINTNRYRVDRKNVNVTKAVDFVGTDGYPYWQGATMMQAAEVFWDSVEDVTNMVSSIKVTTSIPMRFFPNND